MSSDIIPGLNDCAAARAFIRAGSESIHNGGDLTSVMERSAMLDRLMAVVDKAESSIRQDLQPVTMSASHVRLNPSEVHDLKRLGFVIAVEPDPSYQGGVWTVVRGTCGDFAGHLEVPGEANEHGSLRWLLELGVEQAQWFGYFLGLGAKNGVDYSCSVGRVTKGPNAGSWVGWSHRPARLFKVGGLEYIGENESDDLVPVARIEDDREAMVSAARFAQEVS